MAEHHGRGLGQRRLLSLKFIVTRHAHSLLYCDVLMHHGPFPSRPTLFPSSSVWTVSAPPTRFKRYPTPSSCAKATCVLSLASRCRECADTNSLMCVCTPLGEADSLVRLSVLISCTFVHFCVYVLFVTFSRSLGRRRSGSFNVGLRWLADISIACNENDLWLILHTNNNVFCNGSYVKSPKTFMIKTNYIVPGDHRQNCHRLQHADE